MRHDKKKKNKHHLLGAISNIKTFKQAQDQIQFPLMSTEISINCKEHYIRPSAADCPLLPRPSAVSHRRAGETWLRSAEPAASYQPARRNTSHWQCAETTREQSAPCSSSFFAFCVFPLEDSNISLCRAFVHLFASRHHQLLVKK